MKIASIAQEPSTEILFLNAGKGAGSFYVDRLPVLVATTDSLPPDLDAIIATADLQGRERFEEAKGGPPRLLGEALPHRLSDEILPGLGIRAERAGVILAGDFYTVAALDRRGGSGDVTSVWQAFGECFKWTVGVPGNHDTFGDTPHPKARLGHNLHYVDNDRVSVDGLRIVGLGGIIGNPRRPHRRTDREFAQTLDLLLSEPSDVLIMHDGPDVPGRGLRGSPAIRQVLEQLGPPLVVRGHAHWAEPLVELAQGTMVLNVHGRVVILVRHGRPNGLG
jgi:Icc protein